MKRKPENINIKRQNTLNKTLNICNGTGPCGLSGQNPQL